MEKGSVKLAPEALPVDEAWAGIVAGLGELTGATNVEVVSVGDTVEDHVQPDQEQFERTLVDQMSEDKVDGDAQPKEKGNGKFSS